MECPDCRSMLIEVSVSGLDMSYRCFKCGGFWIRPKTVNQLHVEELKKWKPVEVDLAVITSGDRHCPTDGKKLVTFSGDQVPSGMVALRCPECDWWWWSGDTLFRFKPVQEESVRNASFTKKFSALSMYFLPILSLVLLVGMTAAGTMLVKQRQQTQVAADAGVTAFSVTNLGDGNVLVAFKSLRKDVVFEYSRLGGNEWKRVNPEFSYGVYTARLEGLLRGGWYQVRISGATFEFQVD